MKIHDNGTLHLFNDMQALQNIKANPDKDTALQQAARQFEALFLQTVLKHMRQASDALQSDEEGVLNSRQQKFYREMFDGQLALELSRQQSLGIADMLARQLSSKKTFKSEAEAVVLDGQRKPDNVEPFAIAPLDATGHISVANRHPHWATGTASLSQQLQSSRQAIRDNLIRRDDE